MTDKRDAAARLEKARKFFSALPHAVALGMEPEDMGGGVAIMSMPWREDLVGDPETGVIHGGAVSALMDTACGAAAMSHPRLMGATATIGLRIDYMRPATPRATIRVRAECHHITRSVAFVRATATDGDDDRPVATATGTFTVQGGP
ncbi:PaaI family thioesterase [Roseovarius sp. SCSIO 43702]|uniref:PaaI family thioesterase n=1 Tax=Roseovarius sp. SCSIO 43702 TaxID=2823043 RepID=UPI001C736B6C|nr:PaaI family thioesterase [Roseovarius sp. SCSIO 43702]QYX58651.1 PaaI family thioesterase [Roseovarius sp. SCSIO 43702]